MMISVADFKSLVPTEVSDAVLGSKLSAIEEAVRKATNNRFIRRDVSADVIVSGNILTSANATLFHAGDTLDINGRLLEIVSVMDNTITVSSNPRMAGLFKAYLVEYPADIVNGAVNLMKWDLSNRDKVGVKSENISRWSVTYFDLENNSELSFPNSLMGFLKPYKRLRV